ncbi:MAG: hypothetical protein VKP70_09665 [Cyanobacteriota bacterium]|nr:hypothetical protein [Cyanobacteriota bacterium]
MATPSAYGQPTIEKAWRACGAHLSTIALIWVTWLLLSGMGFAVTWVVLLISVGISGGDTANEAASTAGSALAELAQMPFAVVASLVSVLFVAVPALHYAKGETITPTQAFATLVKKPVRYLLAGLLFSLVMSVGFLLCLVPGLVVALVSPVYINHVFIGDMPIGRAFTRSFQEVYGSPRWVEFVILQIVVGLLVVVVSVCTCGLGGLVAVPMSGFYIQNAAYHMGILR